MKILVVNCGSSSLKYQLIDMDNESVLAKGGCERIGIEGSFIAHKPTGKEPVEIKSSMPTHEEAIKLVLDSLVHPEHGVIADLTEINAVGHRAVHGGEKYNKSVIITDEVVNDIENYAELAPLHNPANVIGIKACKAVLPNVPMVAVFDTAFHQTMPDYAYMYGLNYDLYDNYKVRKYGFHGTSHKYVSEKVAEMLDKPVEDTKVIVCHLGNGSSITAVKGGKSIDTTMGFTPLDGLMMGTRSGSVDPAILAYVMKKKNISIEDMDKELNKNSGVFGISGVSSDFRDLWAARKEGNERARLALDMFNYQVKKYIGQYMAVLNGLDALVFTAGIGENDFEVREAVTNDLEGIGIKIDKSKNTGLRGKVADISAEDSKARVIVIPTNEELMIAKETLALI